MDVGGRDDAIQVEIGARVVGAAQQGHVHGLLPIRGIDVAVLVDIAGALFGRVEEEIGIGAEVYLLFVREAVIVDIQVDGRSVYSEGLTKPVRDGDELSVLFIVAGG